MEIKKKHSEKPEPPKHKLNRQLKLMRSLACECCGGPLIPKKKQDMIDKGNIPILPVSLTCTKCKADKKDEYLKRAGLK